MSRNYGKNGEVKENIGKLHGYLGMNFDFTEKVNVEINMDDYVERMINYLPIRIIRSGTALTPSGNNVFENATAKFWEKKKLNSYKVQ